MRYFRYDKSGNQTLSASYWDDPNGPGGDGLTGDGDPDVLLVTRTFYDANDRVTGTAQYTLDPNLWTVDPFEYPQFGTATELADAAQLDSETPDWETVTEYNVLGQVERTVDRYGTETINTYDPRGNLVETRTASKDLFGSAAWVVTRTIYDDNGRVIFTTDPYDMEMELYDAAGGQGFPRPGTYTQYDDAGRVVRTARYQSVAVQLLSAAGGTKTSYTPTDFEIATPLSESFTYYDDAGRVAFTVDPAGLITEFDYDDAGRQEFVTQYLTGTLNTSTWQVDGIVDPSTDVLVTETQYDAAGRVERTIDANGVETKFEYDGVGRVTQTIADEGDPLQGHLNVTTTTHYDKLGHKDYELDALGLRTDYEYDTAGRLTAVILPEVDDPLNPGQRVRPRYEYRYDAYGNQVLIRDPMDDDFGVGSDDKETTFTYDHLGRQTTRTLPEAQTETFTYNTLGQQTLHVDFEDRHTAFEYDEFGRLRKKKFYTDAATYNGGAGTPDQTVTYFDDALGRTVATNDSQFVVATFYVYDAEGRVTRVDSPQGDIHYEYDDLGRLTRTYSGEESDSDGTNVAGETPR